MVFPVSHTSDNSDMMNNEHDAMLFLMLLLCCTYFGGVACIMGIFVVALAIRTYGRRRDWYIMLPTLVGGGLGVMLHLIVFQTIGF